MNFLVCLVLYTNLAHEFKSINCVNCKTYSFSVYVKFPRIGGMGPVNMLQLKSLVEHEEEWQNCKKGVLVSMWFLYWENQNFVSKKVWDIQYCESLHQTDHWRNISRKLIALQRSIQTQTHEQSSTKDIPIARQHNFTNTYNVATCRNPMLNGISPVSWL